MRAWASSSMVKDDSKACCIRRSDRKIIDSTSHSFVRFFKLVSFVQFCYCYCCCFFFMMSLRFLPTQFSDSSSCDSSPYPSRWSGDVVRRTGMKNFNAVSHKRARPYFRIQHGRGEVRAWRVYLNVHSVTGNVVDTERSVDVWRWKCCRAFGNNT